MSDKLRGKIWTKNDVKYANEYAGVSFKDTERERVLEFLKNGPKDIKDVVESLKLDLDRWTLRHLLESGEVRLTADLKLAL